MYLRIIDGREEHIYCNIMRKTKVDYWMKIPTSMYRVYVCNTYEYVACVHFRHVASWMTHEVYEKI